MGDPQASPKTEKGVVPEQLSLQFDEAELTVEEDIVPVIAETTETITYTRNKKGTGRKVLPKSLPFIQNIHDLNDDEKQCACGCSLTHIGDDISEQLDVVVGIMDVPVVHPANLARHATTQQILAIQIPARHIAAVLPHYRCATNPMR